MCAAVIMLGWFLVGPVPAAHAQVCGNDVTETPEQCDGVDDSACPGMCALDCTCAVCGDNMTAPGIETCDGTDDGACTGACQGLSDPFPCQCPVCGDGVLNQLSEACDGSDDAACPDNCTDSCTCAVCGDNVAEGPSESCDGTDDAGCPGQCGGPSDPRPCLCPINAYKCAAKKDVCTGKALDYLLKCHMKAELKSLGPPDPNCIQKGHDKFDGGANPSSGCFEKLETAAAGACFTNDDTGTMESNIDGYVNSVVTAVDPSYPTPVIDKCSAGKKKCISKLTYALLKCYSKTEAKNLPVDQACINKVLLKFNGNGFPAKSCFGKLEGKYTCMTTGDSGTMQSGSETFAHDTACTLDPYQSGCP